ncbi:MAG: AAA family ATPase [Bacteroides sp.]|nr:AAA family ATPase [Bacteroides sp.]
MERKTFSVNYNGVLPNGNNEPKSGNGELVFSSTYVNDNKVKLKSYKDMNIPKENIEDVNKNVSQPIIELKKNRPKVSVEKIGKTITELEEMENETDNDDGLWMTKANKAMEKAFKIKDRESLYKCLWYESEICVLVAKSNLGKSILAVQIANEIAKSGKLVNYLDYELEAKQFQQRYTNEETKQMFKFSDNLLRADLSVDLELDSNGRVERFFKKLEELSKRGVKIFILDNITSLIDRIESGDVIIQFMNRLKRLKEKYGLSILIVAHTTKKRDSEPLRQDNLAGSKKLMNFIDSAFAIGKSLVETDVKYIKQLKFRFGDFIYDEDNVLLCRIVKEDNFPHFIECGYAVEKDLLNTKKSIANDGKRELMQAAYLLHTQGMSNRKIGREMGVSDKTIGKWIGQFENTKALAQA